MTGPDRAGLSRETHQLRRHPKGRLPHTLSGHSRPAIVRLIAA